MAAKAAIQCARVCGRKKYSLRKMIHWRAEARLLDGRLRGHDYRE